MRRETDQWHLACSTGLEQICRASIWLISSHKQTQRKTGKRHRAKAGRQLRLENHNREISLLTQSAGLQAAIMSPARWGMAKELAEENVGQAVGIATILLGSLAGGFFIDTIAALVGTHGSLRS